MSVDQAFAKAIYAIKALSRNQSGLSRPPDDARVKLYGLYKQATEGDIEGIMARPDGDSPQAEAARRKWDAWKSQEGMKRGEAKLAYVGFLLDTMKAVSPQSFEHTPQLAELEHAYERAKANPDSDASVSGTATPALGTSHQRAGSIASHYSAYSQFLRRPQTYSEFGFSDRDRTEQDFSGPVPEPTPSVSGNWKQEIAWQLETINEEINSMRRRYAPYVSGGGPASTPGSVRGSVIDSLDGRSPTKEPSVPASSPLWEMVLHYGRSFARQLGHLAHRMLYDAAGLVAFLVIVRIFATQPTWLQRIPLTRRIVELIGRIVAVILREVGYEVKPLRPAK